MLLCRGVSVELGIVAELGVKARFPFTPLTSCHALDLGGAECIEAVNECYANMEFGRLPVRIL